MATSNGAEVRLVPITQAQRDLLEKGAEFVPVLGVIVETWDAVPGQGLYVKCFLRRGGCTVARTGVAPGRTSCQHCIDTEGAK